MSVYYVGGETLFRHRELDPSGAPMAPQAGVWSVSNPLVASVLSPGRVRWLAAGATDVLYVIPAAGRAGSLHAVVHAAAPATLEADPDPVELEQGALEPLLISALDTLGDPIADLVVDSFASSDAAIAVALPIGPREALILGKAAGACSIHITAGGASLDVPVSVAFFAALTQAEADARYRRLGITIADLEITKAARVEHGGVSGAVPLAWALAARAHAITLEGDTVATLSSIPVGEFLFLDAAQDSIGGHALSFDVSGMPDIEWDDEREPENTKGAGLQDSFMFERKSTTLLAGTRTWLAIPAA